MPWHNNDSDKTGSGQGPWGSQPPQKPGDDPQPTPWAATRPKSGGNGGGNNGGGPEDWLEQAQGWLRRLMAGNAGPEPIVAIAVAAIVALWLMSGFYSVSPDQQGIPKVFGKAAAATVGPGLHYIWPAPIGSVVISTTGAENRITVPDSHQGDNASESLMLTGDENIIDIKFVVLWKISDPLKYEFNIRDQQHIITRAAESAIREVVSEIPIQTALTEGREDVASRTRTVLQKMMDDYGAGVAIDNIELQEVSPPAQVVDAFNDVQRARNEADQAQNDAESYRNNILPRAQGEAARKRQDATGYQAEVVNRATADADRFKAVLQSYSAAKDVTAHRLYLETMEDILKTARKIVTDSQAGTPVVLPYAPPLPAPPQAASSQSDGAAK
jgi:membrane protease subunit HflK